MVRVIQKSQVLQAQDPFDAPFQEEQKDWNAEATRRWTTRRFDAWRIIELGPNLLHGEDQRLACTAGELCLVEVPQCIPVDQV